MPGIDRVGRALTYFIQVCIDKTPMPLRIQLDRLGVDSTGAILRSMHDGVFHGWYEDGSITSIKY